MSDVLRIARDVARVDITVVHAAKRNAMSVAAVLDERGARVWATSPDLDLCEHAATAGVDGLAAKRTSDGELLA